MKPSSRAVGSSGCNTKASSRPVIAAADLEEQIGVSAPTAQAIIKDLIRLGILIEITGQMRGRLYEFQTYLDLFVS